MFLEKLEIQGFKSFAKKNILVFPGMISKDQRGITAVVGPNGSGKSNVADAVRWTLGEQSMKTLRGKKAEDVIFSGTEKKGKLGMAEVSLFLNNEDKQAPIDYSQIVITRRLYRDGNSEYFINNSRVRLSDIQMLLAKASFGQKTYSVIGQGMVEGFLNTSLSERKEFFDEATGVKQYQIKRDDALNKLKSSLENLTQADMLVGEIEPRLKNLTRQVDKIKKREELEKELDEVQLKYYRKSWHEINDKLDEANKRYLEIEKEKLAKDQKVDLLNKKLDSIEQEKTVNQAFGELQENLNRLNGRKNSLYGLLNKLESWLAIKADKIDEIDTKALENKKDQLLKINLEIQNKLEELKKTDNQTKLSEVQEILRTLRNNKEEQVKQSNRKNAWLEMKLESIGQFDLSFLNNRKTEITKELETLKEEQEQSEENISKNENELARLENEKNEIIARVRDFNSELNEVKSLGNKRIVSEVNERLQKALEKLALAEREMDLQKVRASLLEIRDELKKVLAFSTGKEAELKIEKIQKELESISEKREGIIEKINNLRLDINTKKERIRLINNKKSQLENELRDTNGKLEKSQEKFDSSSVRAEISEIEKNISVLDEKIEKAKEALTVVNQKEEEVRNSLYTFQSEIQKNQYEINQINERLNDYRINSAKHETRLEDLEVAIVRGGFSVELNIASAETRIKEIENLIEEVDIQIGQDKEKLDRFNMEQEQKRTQLLNLQRELQTLQQEINQMSNQLNEVKINSTRYETRLEDLETEIRQFYESLRPIKETRLEEEFDKEQAWQRISQIKKQLDQIGGIDPEVEKEYRDTKERFDFLSGQTTDLNNTIESLKDVVKELDITIKERFDKEFKVISQKFEEYFKILFNGGTAKIVKVLADNKELEENELKPEGNLEQDSNLKKIKFLQKYNSTGLAGIEISACPPGKRISSVSMLSGGERALTAIALICAIISANPSPFVVLDEVDAALDEANSERLAKILDELSHKTQFIVISHNRASMRRANILYGVTMGDDGVSKLLSVKLEEVKAARGV